MNDDINVEAAIITATKDSAKFASILYLDDVCENKNLLIADLSTKKIISFTTDRSEEYVAVVPFSTNKQVSPDLSSLWKKCAENIRPSARRWFISSTIEPPTRSFDTRM